ncbi:hypothetical protein M407DRAFT_18898 [Tulasnella calospora MUT 4182]|uniref:Uncharacterized protein n=1 Tax=Tulasnella calospora MUT 4182 TaxID=1051891 RepID=A0A0C3QSS1_9AGAM|nr:hypothetical protein M407DRAFT_18898 [Tulasnella calospora MUT 4182]
MSFCTGMPGRCFKGRFRALVSRTGMSDHFHLSTDCLIVEFEEAVAKLFESTPLLTEAEPPQCYQTENTVGTLEGLKTYAVWRPSSTVRREPGSLPTLLRLVPGLNQPRHRRKFNAVTLQTSPQLSRINLTSYRAPTSEEVLNLATALASTCPALDVVWLNIVSEDDTTTTKPLAFEVFRPLLECNQVTERGWPELKVLLLTREPKQSSDNLASEYGLDISILAHMAQKLRNLTNLGLFLDVERLTDFEGNLEPPHNSQNRSYGMLCARQYPYRPFPQWDYTWAA